MAKAFLKGVCRYTGRALKKPFHEIRDYWHDVSSDEERVARDANFLASMLSLAYDFYEKPSGMLANGYFINKWDEHGYERIPPEEFKDEGVQGLLNDRRCIVFALRKRFPWSGGARDVLVLIRGMAFSFSDVREDLHIVREGLHETKRVTLTEALVLELVYRYGFKNVCLVGHSLGAAVAFLIARKLYLEQRKQTVEGHYFNLPFMCLETLSKEILHVCSLEYAVFHVTLTLLDLESTFNKLKDMVAGGSRHLLFLTKAAKKAENEFVELIDWKPNIYVNPNDRICKSYIDFFENLKKHGIGKSGMSRVTGLLNRFGFEAKAHHLCPSANLIITNKGISTLHSHPLKTWVDVKPRHIRIKSFDGDDDGRIQAKQKLGGKQAQLLLDINAKFQSNQQTRWR